MAIRRLDSRLDSMLTDPGVKPGEDLFSQDAEKPVDEIAPNTEGVQVAALGPIVGIGKALGRAGKVAARGIAKQADVEKVVKENASQIENASRIAEEAKQKAIDEAQKIARSEAGKKAAKTRANNKKEQQQVEQQKVEDEQAAKGNVLSKEVDIPGEAKTGNVNPLTEKPTLKPLADEAVPLTETKQAIDDAAKAVVAPEKPYVAAPDPIKLKQFFKGTLDTTEEPIDIAFDNLADAEDLEKFVTGLQKVYGQAIIEAKRGVISDDELAKMAAKYLNSDELLMKRQLGDVLNAEQMVAATTIVVSATRKVKKLEQQILNLAKQGKEDKKLLLDYENALRKTGALIANYKGAKGEAGRAFRATRIYKDEYGLDNVELMDRHIQELGGVKNIKDIAAVLSDADDAFRAKFMQTGAMRHTESLGRIWKEIWTSGLISSPASLERAFFGNLSLVFARILSTTYAGLGVRPVQKVIRSSKIKSKTEIAEEVTLAEVVAEYANFIGGIPDAFVAAGKAFAKDRPIYGALEGVDYSPPAQGLTRTLFQDPNSPMANAVQYVGNVIRLPYRGMLSVDEGFKAIAYRMELRKIAIREAMAAINMGVSEEDALLLMAKTISDPDADTLIQLNRAMKAGTLQQDLGKVGNYIMEMRAKMDNLGYNSVSLPFGSLLAPFVKTVINAQKVILEYSPAAPIFKMVRDELAAGGARRQIALGKMSVGASVMGFAFHQTLEGRITGLGPSDPKKRQWMKENLGWQPTSIKWGDTYYSYAGLEPIGGLLAIASTVAEMGVLYGKEDDESWANVLLYTTLLPFKYIGQLPMVQGISNLTEFLQEISIDPTGERAGQTANKFFANYGRSMVGGLPIVPMPFSGLVRQIERDVDPTQRYVTTDPSLSADERYFSFLFKSWLSGVPGLSQMQDENGNDVIAPNRNFWGEEVKVGEMGIGQWITPFFQSKVKRDTLSERIFEISNLRGKMLVNDPSRYYANVKLNDAEYSNLKLIMNQITIDGKTMREQLTEDLAGSEEEVALGQYKGVADKMSKTVSDFKIEALRSDAFKSLHTNAWLAIKTNEDRVAQKMDAIKRQEMEDLLR